MTELTAQFCYEQAHGLLKQMTDFEAVNVLRRMEVAREWRFLGDSLAAKEARTRSGRAALTWDVVL